MNTTEIFENASMALLDKDYKKARTLFRKAAESGHRDAMFELGRMYLAGDGVLIDNDAAYRWIRPAAEQGHPRAQYSLGQRYLKGRGVDIDLDKAHEWFYEASVNGFPVPTSTWDEIRTMNNLQNSPVHDGILIVYPCVKTIPQGMFRNRKDFRTVVIPSGINVIGSRAFHGCVNLKDIVLPDDLFCISADAFAGCTSLSTISISSAYSTKLIIDLPPDLRGKVLLRSKDSFLQAAWDKFVKRKYSDSPRFRELLQKAYVVSSDGAIASIMIPLCNQSQQDWLKSDGRLWHVVDEFKKRVRHSYADIEIESMVLKNIHNE